jgi:hypothetical protein
VKEDFGLQECLSCGAQLLVHMDGHVEYKGAEEAAAVDDENDLKTVAREAAAESEAYHEQEAMFDFGEAPPPAPGSEEESPDLVPPSQSQAGYRIPEEEVNLQAEPENFVIGGVEEEEEAPPEPAGDLFEDDRTVLSSPGHEEEAPQEPTTFDFDTPPDGPEEEATPPPPAYVSAENLNSPDLSDVAAFGNSEISGGRDGTLRYNLIIEGIDTADVREAFREAITDRKFVWDIDQILRSVRNGKVQIQNVAPTKGYMLVTRLRGLPLKIRWEQYAIQQT